MEIKDIAVAVIVVIFATSAATDDGDFYSLTVKDNQDNDVSLEKYRGKILLVVNVASECGYTDVNYKQLVLLQEDYEASGFTVLAFPCNQFGNQEPGTNEEIANFAESKYKVNFPLFSKVSVSGENVSLIYDHLVRTTGSAPSWNFCKYLVDHDGEIVQYFSVKDSFPEIRRSVEYLVGKRQTQLL